MTKTIPFAFQLEDVQRAIDYGGRAILAFTILPRPL